jgi:hypothetical protein
VGELNYRRICWGEGGERVPALAALSLFQAQDVEVGIQNHGS